jgi:hypothetical protein
MLYIARFGRTVVSFRNLEILPESWVIFRGAVAAWKSHGELVEDPNAGSQYGVPAGRDGCE